MQNKVIDIVITMGLCVLFVLLLLPTNAIHSYFMAMNVYFLVLV